MNNYKNDGKVRLFNKDGGLVDLNTFYQMAIDTHCHRTFDDMLRDFRNNMRYFEAMGRAEEFGYTEEILERDVAAIKRKYAEYIRSGGVIG